MTIKVTRVGTLNGEDLHTAFRAMVQTHGRTISAAQTALVDSAGGTASSTNTITVAAGAFVNVAASGSSLAGKTTTEAAYLTVKDALLEIATLANTVAGVLGITALTYNGGGTSADGTAGAVTVSVTGAATGVQAAEMNTQAALFNKSFVAVSSLINELCRATGVAELVISNSDTAATYASTVAAITLDGGTAADPGVTKVAVDADLVIMQTNIATMIDVINAICTTADPLVIGG